MSATSANPWRPGTLSLPELPPLSLYVHLPWCLRKCPYCDFNSHEPPAVGVVAGAADGGESETGRTHRVGVLSPAVQRRYLEALRADLEAALPVVWGRRVVSVFIGGGTPSLFDPESVDRLLADIRARLTLVPGCEVTLEANPGTFERERFRGFRAAGVTRLSIGVQSFDDAALHRIGRVHDATQAKAAVALARETFDTFNIDLMYALPAQSLPALQTDLRTALTFEPPHLSVYHLTMEPNTRFGVQPPPGLPDEDLAARMLDEIVQMTGAAGLARYEVSAFARAGHACAHNLNYWQFGDYLGLGAGAHGKISFAHRLVRQVRWRDPATYVEKALAGQAVSNEHEVARRDLPFEFALNALRLRQGFTMDEFCMRTGLPPSALDRPLAQAQARGLIEPVEGVGLAQQRVAATARGFDFLSDLQALFLPD